MGIKQGSTLLVLAFGLIGCAGESAPSRFYLLTSPPDLKLEKQAVPAKGELRLGIGPISLPSHLKRPQIVVRGQRRRVEISEFDRWAEPLDENFTQVLAENLSALLSSNQIATFPWNRSIPVDYQVTVQVLRFDNDTAGNSRLTALWRVFGDGGKKFLFSRKSTFSSRFSSNSFEARVAALNSNLVELSREIAIGISTFSK